MKKTIIASTVAVGLGVTGAASAGNTADASEQGIDKAQLAQLAQSNSSQLNESPVQEGSYNYNFNLNGVDYHFESDGQNFSWSYGENVNGSVEQSTDNSEQAQQTEQPKQESAPKQEAAPQTAETQQPQQEATTTQSSQASEGSSVN
ncbi:transglycosylase, partial [Staphylococcus succinus subsp. succinus]